MVRGSQAQTTSALSPPERTSLATLAFSSPVGARKSLTSLPGWADWKASMTGWTVVSLTQV